jgi:RNA polymerase sigma-54 factor
MLSKAGLFLSEFVSMKHHLQLKLGQHLALTPQLQQSIRLLQLSTLELNQEIEQILQENPLLEREGEGEEASASEEMEVAEGSADESLVQSEGEPAAGERDELLAAPDDMDWNDYSAGGTDEEDDGSRQTPAASATLREHLLGQAALLPLPPRDRALLNALIDALNEDGYLEQPLEELAVAFEADPPIEFEEMAIALRHLQNLDPAGVGARSLGECLSLQLKDMPESTTARQTALRITDGLLDLLAARDVGKLKKMLHIDDAELRAARQLILKLNPKPGAQFCAGETQYVIPDVYVRKQKGVWIASLNPDAMPRLRINRVYADILARHRDSGGQLANQLQEAKWLIKNVQQRFDTILRVSQAIVDRQRNFLEHGEVAMRPLVLREIADAVDLHESTISRVTTQKYMMTPRGLYELKYFFGSHVATEAGGVCSSTAIRALIKQLVAAEDAQKPLSDGQLAEILAQQGIVVARRTVAKYRESLHIPTANMRKGA